MAAVRDWQRVCWRTYPVRSKRRSALKILIIVNLSRVLSSCKCSYEFTIIKVLTWSEFYGRCGSSGISQVVSVRERALWVYCLRLYCPRSANSGFSTCPFESNSSGNVPHCYRDSSYLVGILLDCCGILYNPKQPLCMG